MGELDILEEVAIDSCRGKAVLTSSEMDLLSLLEFAPGDEFSDSTDHMFKENLRSSGR